MIISWYLIPILISLFSCKSASSGGHYPAGSHLPLHVDAFKIIKPSLLCNEHYFSQTSINITGLIRNSDKTRNNLVRNSFAISIPIRSVFLATSVVIAICSVGQQDCEEHHIKVRRNEGRVQCWN
jgi:hypothetical protein